MIDSELKFVLSLANLLSILSHHLAPAHWVSHILCVCFGTNSTICINIRLHPSIISSFFPIFFSINQQDLLYHQVVKQRPPERSTIRNIKRTIFPPEMLDGLKQQSHLQSRFAWTNNSTKREYLRQFSDFDFVSPIDSFSHITPDEGTCFSNVLKGTFYFNKASNCFTICQSNSLSILPSFRTWKTS